MTEERSSEEKPNRELEEMPRNPQGVADRLHETVPEEPGFTRTGPSGSEGGRATYGKASADKEDDEGSDHSAGGEGLSG